MRLLLPSAGETIRAGLSKAVRRAATEYYVGLDVSLKSTHICVLDQDREMVLRGIADTQSSMIAERLARWKGHLAKVGLETGSMTPWLYHELKGQGFPVVCMDARRAADTLNPQSQ